MTVVPLRRNELARWRGAINAAAERLSFALACSQGQTTLVATEVPAEGDQVDRLAARGLIQLHADLDRFAQQSGRLFRSETLLATAFRDRLRDLMEEPVSLRRLRYATVSSAEARQAYAEALAALLRSILERAGPKAVKAIAAAADPLHPTATDILGADDSGET
jgi:hypothetical protein